MKLLLKAKVTTATGKTRHAIGSIIAGIPVPMKTLPVPDYVCIGVEPEGFFLLHFEDKGTCFADTWHQSIDEAKAQARHEFGILDCDWTNL